VGDAEGRSPASRTRSNGPPAGGHGHCGRGHAGIIGGQHGSPTNSQVNNMGYPELCTALAAMYPGQVWAGTPVNFPGYRKFTWVALGSASAYVGSGYQSSHLYKANHTHSSSYFNATDCSRHGGPRGGQLPGGHMR
jgi:hypothetical protein